MDNDAYEEIEDCINADLKDLRTALVKVADQMRHVLDTDKEGTVACAGMEDSLNLAHIMLHAVVIMGVDMVIEHFNDPSHRDMHVVREASVIIEDAFPGTVSYININQEYPHPSTGGWTPNNPDQEV